MGFRGLLENRTGVGLFRWDRAQGLGWRDSGVWGFRGFYRTWGALCYAYEGPTQGVLVPCIPTSVS